MRARLLLVTLARCAGCYESHTRRSPVEPGPPVDAGPPRQPHRCAIAPIEIAELYPFDPLDPTGKVRVVARGSDYAVAWSPAGGSGGLVILRYDGRVIALDTPNVDVVALEDGFLLTHRYSDTFSRVSAEGEPIGEPLVLPEIVPPHWQSLERHGDRMHFVAHARTSADPHVFELDLAAWTYRRSPFTPITWGRWSFASDRALVVDGSVPEVPALVAQGQRLRPDGTAELAFELPLGSWRATDVRYDPWSESWLVAGSADAPDARPTFARVSATGALVQQATLEPDAELAALFEAARGARVAVAPSPIGPALAITTNYFGEETTTNVTIAYPSPDSSVFTGDLVLGTRSAWDPAIVWSEADAGFAVVTVDRDESGRAFVALRCGLRPD